MSEQLYTLTFWSTIAFTVIGAILGLSAVWFENWFRSSDTAWRLVVTDIIFTVTSLIVAIITK